jgi:hypothetical protein
MTTLIFLPLTTVVIIIMVINGKITTPKFMQIMAMIPSLVVPVAMKFMEEVEMTPFPATTVMIN